MMLDTVRPARTSHARTPIAIVLLTALAFAPGCTGPAQGGKRAPFTTEAAAIDDVRARKFTTEHFVIYSTLQDTEMEGVLPSFLEASYARYADSFPAPAPQPIQLTTYVFGNRTEWLRFVGRHFPARAGVYGRIRAGGFTEGTTAYLFYSQRAETLATLAHEGWHQYLGARLPRGAPAWLNEGLACYHEAFYYAKDRPEFTPQTNTFRIESLRSALQMNQLMPLKTIVATDAGEVISQNHSITTQVYYAQAWALVTFLRHGDGGRHRRGFEQLMRDLDDGSFAAKAGAAELTAGGPRSSYGEAIFTYYFGAGPESLARAYHDHVVNVSGF